MPALAYRSAYAYRRPWLSYRGTLVVLPAGRRHIGIGLGRTITIGLGRYIRVDA